MLVDRIDATVCFTPHVCVLLFIGQLPVIAIKRVRDRATQIDSSLGGRRFRAGWTSPGTSPRGPLAVQRKREWTECKRQVSQLPGSIERKMEDVTGKNRQRAAGPEYLLCLCLVRTCSEGETQQAKWECNTIGVCRISSRCFWPQYHARLNTGHPANLAKASDNPGSRLQSEHFSKSFDGRMLYWVCGGSCFDSSSSRGRVGG